MNTEEPYPLPDSLYPDSKDWVASDYWGRVELLHFMYESTRREVEQLEAAQPEQEPVAWLSIDCIGERYLCFSKPNDNDEVYPLFAAPLQRKPLTEAEIYELLGYGSTAQYTSLPQYALACVRAIEKAHGII